MLDFLIISKHVFPGTIRARVEGLPSLGSFNALAGMLESRMPQISTCGLLVGSAESAKVNHGWHRATAKSPAPLPAPPQSSTSPASAPSALGIWSMLEKYWTWDDCVSVPGFGTRGDSGPGYRKSTQKCCLQWHLRCLQAGVKYCLVNCLEEKPWEGNLSLFLALIYNVGQIT